MSKGSVPWTHQCQKHFLTWSCSGWMVTFLPLLVDVSTMLVHRCLHRILRDARTLSCLHHFLLEFIGTALFLCVSLSAVLVLPEMDLRSNQSNVCNLSNQINLDLVSAAWDPPGLLFMPRVSPLQMALVFGTSITIAAVCVGGEVHLNPAITIAMVLSLRLRLWRAALSVIGQLLGAVVSTALLLGLSRDVTPALNQVPAGVQLHQAVIVETVVTLQLVLVVMATANVPLPTVISPLLVGLAVSVGHLVALNATGCGMNPARSFGPAVVTLNFKNHWVYWAGPALGACLAVLLNDVLLRPRWRCPGDWWAELQQLYLLTDKQQQVELSHLP